MKLLHTTMSGLIACTAVGCTLAVADDSGWYTGAGVGQSRAEIDAAQVSAALLDGGFSATSIADDERDLGYKLFGGYQINRYIALEGGYFDLGEFGFRANTVPLGTLRGEIEVRGVNLDAIGFLPLTEQFSAFGRVGVTHAEAEASFRGSGAVEPRDPHSSERATNYKYGIGLQYAFTESIAMRIEAERYRISDTAGDKGDIDLFSLGLLYRFGQRQAVAAAPVAPPTPVAEAAPTAPQPPPRAPAKVAFSADSLFDFDQEAVKPAGKQALDTFVAELRGTHFDVITVTGHTDRLGSHDYNMKLSMRRADAVKAYLVQSAGIPANKIVARGVNGAEPVTLPGACKGERATPQLIACLQPDRRVEIEVTGTKH